MAEKSKIEWTDATWNVVTGCTKVSAGCKNCYAEREFPRVYPGRKFTDVKLHEDRLDMPLRWKRPRRIFVNSLSDLFHESIPEEFIGHIFAVMARCPQHTFQILTKRPKEMLDLLENAEARWGPFQDTIIKQSPGEDWPLPNVWLGVSVENQPTADERIPLLLQTPAAVRWVSYEPALGPLDFYSIVLPDGDGFTDNTLEWGSEGTKIDWVVAGGESGPRARPSHPDWFRSVRDQCQAASVPFFFKQWGEWGPTDGQQTFSSLKRLGKKRAGRLLDGQEWNEYPEGK